MRKGDPGRADAAVAQRAASAAVAILLESFERGPTGVSVKDGPADWVSDADRDAQTAIVDVLREVFPEDAIVAEELGQHDAPRAQGRRWFVDPLDGTANYLAGIPHWCVSIGCEDDTGTLVGLIVDPGRDETFLAVRGQGVTLNGERVARRQRPSLSASILTGTLGPVPGEGGARPSATARKLYRAFGQVRSFGSCALDLAWTAIGRCDVMFHEERSRPWDRSAGLLLCSEMGLRGELLPPVAPSVSERILVTPPEWFDRVAELVA